MNILPAVSQFGFSIVELTIVSGEAIMNGLIQKMIIILIMFCSCIILSSDCSSTSSRSFSSESLPTEMTLSEALRMYPEIFHEYGFRIISDIEAEAMLREGIDVINGDNYNAREFLDTLNYRQK